ncbi:MAG: hypothetical protein N3A53_04990 [Verrucomicrobiae bacterium]|nr:hypothetical protein [Verrucomicrobiae bacterium]
MKGMQNWHKTVVKIRKPSCRCLMICGAGFVIALLSLPIAMWAVEQVEKWLGTSNPLLVGVIGGGILTVPSALCIWVILRRTRGRIDS